MGKTISVILDRYYSGPSIVQEVVMALSIPFSSEVLPAIYAQVTGL